MKLGSSSMSYALYLVTDRALAGQHPLLSVIDRAVSGGATVVQIREKDASTRQFLEVAKQAKDLLGSRDVPMIINDRIDVALAVGAAGVHLGQDDMPCSLARKIVGKDMIVGVSINNEEEALRAERNGANYLGVSPIFDSPTKTDTDAAIGLKGLAKIRSATKLPLIGIGGIGVNNAREVIRAGADGIAVVSAVMAAPDPHGAARALFEVIEEARKNK